MKTPPRRLPDDREKCLALRDAQLKTGHGRTTRKQYRSWMRRYRYARASKHCRDLQGYLTRLSTVERVNPKTVHQALCALKFYHEKVLGIEIPPNSLQLPRINRNRNHPNFLNREEAVRLLQHLEGLPLLQAQFLIGTGSRINAMLTLRLKDLDLSKRVVALRFDKGGKTRSVPLPEAIIPALRERVEEITDQWEIDKKRGIICPVDDPSLFRKLGPRTLGTLPWRWLFPSGKVRPNGLWHATSHALQDAIREAAGKARITKRVTLHTLRHTNATFLLERGENIRRIQEHLGHSNLETTEIYLHATAHEGMRSPLDDLPAIIPFTPAAGHRIAR